MQDSFEYFKQFEGSEKWNKTLKHILFFSVWNFFALQALIQGKSPSEGVQACS